MREDQIVHLPTNTVGELWSMSASRPRRCGLPAVPASVEIVPEGEPFPLTFPAAECRLGAAVPLPPHSRRY
jgi:hypothetical protein